MARFVVFAPDRPVSLEKAIFVEDGFRYGAFLFGPFWLLKQGSWRAALLVALGFFFLMLAGLVLGLPENVQIALTGLFSLLIGLEAASLRGWELGRRGYRQIGLVVGDDRDALERRFFSAAMAEPSPEPRAGPMASPPAEPQPAGRAKTGNAGVLGLFPQPDARYGRPS